MLSKRRWNTISSGTIGSVNLCIRWDDAWPEMGTDEHSVRGSLALRFLAFKKNAPRQSVTGEGHFFYQSEFRGSGRFRGSNLDHELDQQLAHEFRPHLDAVTLWHLTT